MLPGPRAKALSNDDVDALEPEVALKVLDLAIRIGELLIATGAAANDTLVLVVRLCAAYGMRTVYVDVTATGISISYHRGYNREPLTIVRTVVETGMDYSTMEALERLVADVEVGGLPTREVNERLHAIVDAPAPYPGWFSMVGTSLVGVGASMLYGATWQVMVIALVLGCAVYGVIHAMNRRYIPPFYVQAVAAATFVLGASGIWLVGQRIPLLQSATPDLVTSSVIVMLVVGIMAVGAVQDAIDEFYLTAAARLVESLMLTAGIVVGIIAGLKISAALGIDVPVTTGGLPYGPVWMQLLGALLVAAMYSVETHSSWRVIGLSGACGLLGWMFYLTMHQLGNGEVTANGVAALGAAYAAAPLGRAARVPIIAVVTAAIIPLVPGTMLVNALRQIAFAADSTALGSGFTTLYEALALALAIAIGATLGIFLGRRNRLSEELARRSGRVARRILAPSRARGTRSESDPDGAGPDAGDLDQRDSAPAS